jgi:putative ABC transport system permease protein
VFIVSWGTGLNQEQITKLSHLKGIVPGDLLPIAVASPEFGGSSLFALGTAAVMPDATMFFGIDPAQGMRMLKLDFRQGNAADAARLLDQGDHIIVTDEFRQIKHLGVGDALPLHTDRGIVNFKIAGVVWSPGMDLINSKFDMGRQFDQRTGASIFGSMGDAKKYFSADRGGIRLFAANLDPSASKDAVLVEVQKQLNIQGLQAGDVRAIKQTMKDSFADLLLVVSAVPFGAMLVASLGVTNTIMASIRTRRWQLGVLRSIGLTQSQLLRLIFCEAMLVGIIGCGMGLSAGALMTVDAHQLSRIVTGYHPNIAVPWVIISVGTAVVMCIAVLAGAWPAISVAKAEPLSLLQAGRAAA